MKHTSLRAPLILASASPRRRQLLLELGIPLEIFIPETDEVFYTGDPRRTALENAQRKNDWACARRPDRMILSADTVISFRGQCLAKPASREDASAMLLSFSGAEQVVITAVMLSCPGAAPRIRAVESSVVFKRLNPDLVGKYFSCVDPMDKAGAYDINQHGDLIIESFSGSRTNIMGLPVELIVEWIIK